MFRKFWFATAVLVLSSGFNSTNSHQPPETLNIIIDQTTMPEVTATFGEPFRIANEAGGSQWTYEFNPYSSGGPGQILDLNIRFDQNHVVKSYTMSSAIKGRTNGAVAVHKPDCGTIHD